MRIRQDGAYDVASLILTNGADLNAYSSSTYFDLNIGTFATIDASSTLDLGYRSRTTFGETMEVEGFHRVDILDNKKAPPEGEAGGRGGIRTHGTLLHKAFLVPHHRPLGHSSMERTVGFEPTTFSLEN